ncbi:MAG TPA: outer membrane lipoprotein carrier protein LolA [Candidatus Angelobacter sp.]
MRLSCFIPVALVALLAGLALPAQAADAVSAARAVDEYYNRLQTFKGAFTEIYQAPGISRSESGVLWLKKPGRMRWEYQTPKSKLFIVDSQNAYFYVPGERQARKTSLKKIDDIRSPLRFLLGKTKLEKELDGLSLAPDVTPIQSGDLVLRGVPKSMRDRVSEILLEVSPAHQITRIVIQGTDGTSTDFRFSQMEDNIPLADSFFRFQPPPGVTTIQDDQAAQ